MTRCAVGQTGLARRLPATGLVPARVEVAPQCPGGAVSLDDQFLVRAALYGSATLDVTTIAPRTVGLAGGRPRRMTVVDIDGDGHDDLGLFLRPSDMTLMHSGSERALFNARTHDQELLVATPEVDPAYWPDTDGDRVIDPCDQCAGTPAGTSVDPTGCP